MRATAVALWLCLGTLAHGQDISIDRLEINQAIQTATNDVPLIAQRSTLVRAFLQVHDSRAPIDDLTGRLHVRVDGIPVTPAGGVPAINQPFTAPLAPDRTAQADAMNFEILAPTGIVAGAYVEFEVEVDPFPGESDPTNNTLIVDDVPVISTATPRVYYVPMEYTPSGGGYPTDWSIEVGRGDAYLKGVLPVNDADPVLYQDSQLPPISMDYAVNGNGYIDEDLSSYPNEVTSVFQELGAYRQLIVENGIGATDRTYVVGWFPKAACPVRGYATINSKTCFMTVDPDGYQRAFAHELTHCFGYDHVCQDLGDVGWDVGGRLLSNPASNDTYSRIKVPGLLDYMAPGKDTNQSWVSRTLYEDFLCDPVFRECGGVNPPLVNDILVVQGGFDPDGRIVLDPAFRYPWASQPSRETREVHYYTIELINASQAATRFQFEPEQDGPNCDDDPIQASFDLAIDPGSGFGEIELLNIYDPSGQLIHTQRRTPLRPHVQIFDPPRGTLVRGRFLLDWRDQDLDSNKDDMMFHVAGSPDGGRSFVPLGVRLRDSKLEIDSTVLPTECPPNRRGDSPKTSRSTHEVLLRIFASDGLNTTWSDTTVRVER